MKGVFGKYCSMFYARVVGKGKCGNEVEFLLSKGMNMIFFKLCLTGSNNCSLAVFRA